MALDSLDPLTAPMPAPPVRQFSFTDFQTNNPTAPPPGDRLDAEFDRANNAIEGTIAWANVSLNTDGTLRDAIVGESNLQPDLFDSIASDAIAQVQPLVDQAAGRYSASAGSSSVSASSSATSAASQAVISQGAAGRANNAQVAAEAARDASQGYADDASAAAGDAWNAGNDAEGAAALAQDYADVTQAWAEHMPDPIPPNILAVMGITGDHWSSRWWANQAAAAFGALTSLYLGAFPTPPTQTPTGGAIPIGAIYYNTVSGQPYVWNGTAWVPFYAPTKAVTLSLAYSASGSQTAFPLTTVDLAGNNYSMNATTPEPLEVWVNGVRLLLNVPAGIGDWNVNAASSTVTLTAAPRAGSIVQIDVLTPASQLAPSQVVTKGLAPFTPIDGATTTFPLKLGDGTPITALTAAELFISVDGTVQQPGIDFSTIGGSVTFTEAPLLGSKVWSYWYGQGSGDAATGGGAAGLYLPLTGGTMSGPLIHTATGTTASRSVQERAADWVNVKDHGAKLDGVANDSAAYSAARTVANSRHPGTGGVVVVPFGTQYGLNTAPTFAAPAVLWKMDGVAFPGGTPVTNITTGDLVETFFTGQKYFGRTDVAGAAGAPILRIDYSGPGTANGVINLNITNTDADFYTWGVSSILNTTLSGSGQTCGFASEITRKSGAQPGWLYFGHYTDQTGQGKGVLGFETTYPGHVMCELGATQNGPDLASSSFAPESGGRVGLHFANDNYNPPSWAANHAYVLADEITPGNGYVYIVTVAGTSGAAPPTWRMTPGTVTDGSVTWKFQTTVKSSISRMIDIEGPIGLGAALNIHGVSIYDAGIEMSTATLDTVTNPNAAAIRIGANMPIDFSGNGTAAGQNLHTLKYDSTAARLIYAVGGVAKFSIDASGNIRCAGTVTGSVAP